MKRRAFPEVAELRRYLPAIEAGVRALRAREHALGDRFEPVGEELVQADRKELEELRSLLDGLTEGET